MDGLFDAAKELFGYNRESYFFDSELRMKREYQEQNLRVKQFMLYREDVRDLTELTTGKMDSYLLVALLELGCCFDLMVHGDFHGRVIGDDPITQPTWLLWLYVVSLAEAFLYLFLSAWFAIHASVAAHSFAVRLLTQFVRLPIPDRTRLDAARAYAAEFEGLGAQQMLRVPMMSSSSGERQPEVQAATSASNIGANLASLGSSSPVATLKHVRLYRNLQSNWQAHDAYARACLALGTYTLTQAVAYYAIGYFVVQLHCIWPALSACIVLPALAWLLIRLDLYFGSYAMVAWALALMLGPLLAWVATVMDVLPPTWMDRLREVHIILVPVNFLMHVALIASIVAAARADQADDRNVSLPTRFRTVLYLDVFGWVTDPEARQLQESQERARARLQAEARRQLPPQLLESLRAECRLLAACVRLELDAWEGQQACGSVWAVPGLKEMLREVRQAFTQLHGSMGLDVSTLPEGPIPDLWLRLVPEDAVECYVSPETGEARREPPEGAHISDLSRLRYRLASLSQRCELLRSAGQTLQPGAVSSPRLGGRASIPRRLQRSSTAGSEEPAVDSFTHFRLPQGEGIFDRQWSCRSQPSEVEPSPRQQQAGEGLPQLSAMMTPASSACASPFFTAASAPSHSEWPLPSRSSHRSGYLSESGDAGNPFDMQPIASGEPPMQMDAWPLPRRPAALSVASSEGGAGMPERKESAAQETRFGGQEAAQVEALGGGLFACSHATAQTFHPRQDGRRESRRPPGQVPWITFLSASIVVGGVWMMGVGEYVVEPIWMLWHQKSKPALLQQDGRLLHAERDWPWRPTTLEATGLACHGWYGPSAFLTERFAVHELPLDGRPPSQSRAAHACLARAPAFHAAGLAGAALECAAPGHCALVLRSAGAQRALKCPLAAAPANLPRQPALVTAGAAGELSEAAGWQGSCSRGSQVLAARGPEVWIFEREEEDSAQQPPSVSLLL